MEKIITEIMKERLRQVESEGWSHHHDNEHSGGELALAAACYAGNIKLTDNGTGGKSYGDVRQIFVVGGGDRGASSYTKSLWPWATKWDKRHIHDRKKQLIIAAALIMAELERMERN